MAPDVLVDWSGLPAPQARLGCTVVLPARNEARLLPRALKAIASQREVDFAYEVIVLANNCSDDTATRARAFAARGHRCPVHVVEVAWPQEIANVGRARRALMEVAAQRLSGQGGSRALIVSTDADTHVADDWLAATVAAIDAGADAVGGRIVPVVDADLPATARQLMRLDDRYRTWRERLECLVDPDPIDPWPRHHQHFGASLAVTAQAYRAVGGLPLVPFLEDEALVRELHLADKALRHCPRVRVRTSARLDGRVEVGLSWQLREWAGRGAEQRHPHVADPIVEAEQWARRRRMRELWREADSTQSASRRLLDGTAQLANSMRIDRRWLFDRLGSAPTFGRLWHEMAQAAIPPSSTHEQALVPMDDALITLRRLVRARRRRAPV